MVGVIAAGSTFRCTIAGLPDALALLEGFREIRGLVDRDAKSPNARA
jgi:hypothetical protein